MIDTAIQEGEIKSLALPDEQLLPTLHNTVYPGAKPESVQLVLDYCRAQHLDPLMRPVHIVPMYVEDKVTGGSGYRDCILPGIDLYRVRAARTGEHIGTSEPEFGPTIDMEVGNERIKFPEWCRVVVTRLVSGHDAEYPAREYWLEAYASKKRTDFTPNYMWMKRPFAQLAKCAEALALRKAFPESSPLVTAEEMAGKAWGDDTGTTIDGESVAVDEPPKAPKAKPKTEPKTEAKGATVEGEAQTVADDRPPAEKAKPAEPAKTKPVRYISDGQVRLLHKQLEELNINPDDLCIATKTDAIESMPSIQFNAALKWLKLQREG